MIGQTTIVGRIEAAPVAMTEVEARGLVCEIISHLRNARRQLPRLHDEEGWRALGYGSRRECALSKFPESEPHLYRLLNAARVERVISPKGETLDVPERHLRPLVNLTPDQQRRAWAIAKRNAPHGRVTARVVAEAVASVAGPKTTQLMNGTLETCPCPTKSVASITRPKTTHFGACAEGIDSAIDDLGGESEKDDKTDEISSSGEDRATFHDASEPSAVRECRLRGSASFRRHRRRLTAAERPRGHSQAEPGNEGHSSGGDQRGASEIWRIFIVIHINMIVKRRDPGDPARSPRGLGPARGRGTRDGGGRWQSARPETAITDLTDPHVGSIRVVKQTERALIGRLQRTLEHQGAVELELHAIALDSDDHLVPVAGTERERVGTAPMRGLCARVFRIKRCPLELGVGQPVNLDAFGIQNESQAIERGVDQGLLRIIKELVSDLAVVGHRAVILNQTPLRTAGTVLDSEPIPLGHRQTIRRYFELIRPRNGDGDAKSEPAGQPPKK